MIKSIVVITPNYPHPKIPYRGTFVETLVREWEQLGIKTNVIAPFKIKHIINFLKNSYLKEYNTPYITRPIYLSFSTGNIFGLNLDKLSRTAFVNAAIRAKSKAFKPELYYGKFLLSGGAAATILGEMYNKPSFVDLGESKLVENFDEEKYIFAKRIIHKLAGIICVSERLKQEAIQLGAKPKNILLAPNSVDRNIFKPMDKNYCRYRLNLPQNDFLISFIGSFIERKGPLRLLEAIKKLKNNNIYGIFLGDGKQFPTGEKVIHAGPVAHNELPLWLNASDLFVLPSLAEGHCNAINEAMACGIPIISSDIPDINSQLPPNIRFLIDPHSIESISKAIYNFYKDVNSLQNIKKRCLEYSNTISYQRGRYIVKWISEMVCC